MSNADTSVGFRSKFSGGSFTGIVGTNGKMTSLWKHNLEIFEVGFQTVMNFKAPDQPV